MTNPEITDAVMRQLRPYLEDLKVVPDDDLDLVEEIYRRVKKVHDIKAVQRSNSWDYCKQTAIDWINGVRRWIPVHYAAWDYQLGCVPPTYQTRGLFMCGEAYTGNYYLTFFSPGSGRYYCCLMTRNMLSDKTFFDSIPFADELPMLGIPKGKEAES